MDKSPYIRAGQISALFSFIIGSIIIISYSVSLSGDTAYFGLLFIILAFVVNLVIAFILIFKAITKPTIRKKSLITIGLMLLNIPIVMLYLRISNYYGNQVRLHLHNDTSTTLTNIRVTGCQLKQIDQLAAGADKTVIIDITGDCAIHINYLHNGKQKSETILDYETPGGGQNLDYHIGGHNDPF